MKQKDIGETPTYFQEGWNCCEATLLAASDILDLKSNEIPRIATCFGGGMNGSGGTCGLYTGALLSIGLAFGRHTLEESKEKASETAKAFQEFWKKEMREVNCRELLDLDYPPLMTDKAERKAYGKEHRCMPMYRQVTKWLKENLE